MPRRAHPDHRLQSIRHIDSEHDLPELDDHDLIYEIYGLGYSVMVNSNWKIKDSRAPVAVEQTRFTLLCLEGKAGLNPIVTDALLRDLLPVLRQQLPRGEGITLDPKVPRSTRSFKLLETIANQQENTVVKPPQG